MNMPCKKKPIGMYIITYYIRGSKRKEKNYSQLPAHSPKQAVFLFNMKHPAYKAVRARKKLVW